MHSESRKDAPQSILSIDDSKLPGATTSAATVTTHPSTHDSTNNGYGEGGWLNSLSDDVLLTVLLYCGPIDVDERLKLVNRRFHNATSLSTTLWREFCLLTGKAVDAKYSVAETQSDSQVISDEASEDDTPRSSSTTEDAWADACSNPYRRYYYRNPCVPTDFRSIQEALEHCPWTVANSTTSLGDDRTCYSPVGTVVLMPGVYDERVRIGGKRWAEGGRHFDVEIRAAFPRLGATIVSPPSEWTADVAKDEPCVSISTCDDDTLGGVQKQVTARLSHLRILHSSPGSNIWGGNTAIDVEGRRAQVVVESCVLQSDSGRGVVVANQAVIELFRTSIVDCAATGLYLGDWGSSARISGCNIVRNGVGSKRLHSPSPDDGEAGNLLDRIRAQTRMASLGRSIPREEFEVVPPGHSGVYIESSMCWIDDSLIGGNCLTGISVVRGGFVSLSNSDITENGSTPVMIEDTHDVRDRTTSFVPRLHIRGGVVEGPLPNNYTSIQSRLQGDGKKQLCKGGVVRPSHLATMSDVTPSVF